jgi:hypothetical protein
MPTRNLPILVIENLTLPRTRMHHSITKNKPNAETRKLIPRLRKRPFPFSRQTFLLNPGEKSALGAVLFCSRARLMRDQHFVLPRAITDSMQE